MEKLAIAIASFLLLVGLVSAGTITLTGTCKNNVYNGNTVFFTLSSSGNDTAYSLLLTPVIQNAQPTSASYPLVSLAPNTNATFNVTLKNVRAKGTSPAYFILTYQQGGTPFTAVFPCLLNFFNATVSHVLISSSINVTRNGTVSVKISAFNGGTTPINANVSLVVPPTFTFLSSRYYLVNVTPFKTVNVTFYLGFPYVYQSSYSGGAFATYAIGNVSYASLTNLAIAHQTGSVSTSPGSLFSVFAVAAVAIILALILISMLRSRRRKELGVV